MKVISQRREQARWAYNGAVLEVKKEIPDKYQEDGHRRSAGFHRPACGVGPDSCCVFLPPESDQRHNRLLGPEAGVPAN